MKYILIISLFFLAPEAQAQFGKRLKDKARETAERKANQKADEALNKGVDKIDSVITGKKREPKENKSTQENTLPEAKTDNKVSSNTDNGSSSAESTYKELIIKTNIRCETGKKRLETILRNTDGVSSVMIDNDNGNLYLSSEKPDVSNKVIDLIRQNGFETDGKKPTKTFSNPCN